MVKGLTKHAGSLRSPVSLSTLRPFQGLRLSARRLKRLAARSALSGLRFQLALRLGSCPEALGETTSWQRPSRALLRNEPRTPRADKPPKAKPVGGVLNAEAEG